MIRRPPRSTQSRSSAASDVYKRQEEKFRLIWDNIPIWYEMRNLGNLFASNNAYLVADTYTNAWAVDIRIDDPLTSMADAYMKVYLNTVSYTHLRAHETRHDLVCRLLLE